MGKCMYVDMRKLSDLELFNLTDSLEGEGWERLNDWEDYAVFGRNLATWRDG